MSPFIEKACYGRQDDGEHIERLEGGHALEPGGGEAKTRESAAAND